MKPEHLRDVKDANAHWHEAREREAKARAVLVGALREAKKAGATLEEMSNELGVSRQYVHKLLR